MSTPATLRWGILGTGTIARKFADGLASSPSARLEAVGSRRIETARAFAARVGAARAHGGYEDLVADPHIDVVYVATPHSMHHDLTLLAVDAGKHVLCEKPFALNASEARAMVAGARARRRFLMEAMWTRCLPAMRRFGALVRYGAIGTPHMLTADFGFRDEPSPGNIVFDRTLGGGALLDVGVYGVSLASWLLGPAVEVAALAKIGDDTGVDELSGAVLKSSTGALALVSSSIRHDTPQEAVLTGTTGQLRLEAPWWAPTRVRLVRPGRADVVEDHPYRGNGYAYEAEEVARCIADGRDESDLLPLDESIRIMETLDAIRRQAGPTYPADEMRATAMPER